MKQLFWTCFFVWSILPSVYPHPAGILGSLPLIVNKNADQDTRDLYTIIIDKLQKIKDVIVNTTNAFLRRIREDNEEVADMLEEEAKKSLALIGKKLNEIYDKVNKSIWPKSAAIKDLKEIEFQFLGQKDRLTSKYSGNIGIVAGALGLEIYNKGAADFKRIVKQLLDAYPADRRRF